MPAPGRDAALVRCVYEYFKDNPHRFEYCAAKMAAMMDANITIETVTRPAVTAAEISGLGLFDPCPPLSPECFHLSRLFPPLRFPESFRPLVLLLPLSRSAIEPHHAIQARIGQDIQGVEYPAAVLVNKHIAVCGFGGCDDGLRLEFRVRVTVGGSRGRNPQP
jgi:hypothetical protein